MRINASRAFWDLTFCLPPATASATPTFSPFDSTSELWKDYWSQFLTFTRAHAVPDDRKALVFLTNQSSTVYKLLSNLAAQETPPREINDLTMDQIVAYTKVQFDPTRFVIREHFKLWTTTQHRPRGSPFKSWLHAYVSSGHVRFCFHCRPLDEALRTRFLCSVNSEAVLNSLFKMKADELDVTTAMQVAIQTEDATKVEKETVYGPKSVPALVIAQKPSRQQSTPREAYFFLTQFPAVFWWLRSKHSFCLTQIQAYFSVTRHRGFS